jgi:Repeat of unknown function (DUF5648)
MFIRFLKFQLLAFIIGLFAGPALAIQCPEAQVDYNGVCKYLRTTSTKPAPFVPTAVKNAENINLYPRVMPAKCATDQSDSDCVTTYSYVDTSLPAVISASFTNSNPTVGIHATSPQWTTSNAVSLNISCSGVAGVLNQSAALQATPSSISFTSNVPGVQTCIYTATNPFGNVSSASSSVVFLAAPPPPPPPPIPTINVSRTPLPFTAGQTHSINWSTANATSVYQVCTSSGTGYTYTGPQALSGGGTGLASSAWVGYPTHCVWTATGPGGTATAIDDFSTVAAPVTPPVQVYRLRTPDGIYYYTYSIPERDALVTSYGWVNEGPAFKVYAGANDIAGLLPAHRFYTDYGGHFWTISEWEKATVLANYPQYHYEGIGWYAAGSAVSGAIPLYRLYNNDTNSHFYTASQAEHDWIIANLPTWWDDGASMYVWP